MIFTPTRRLSRLPSVRLPLRVRHLVEWTAGQLASEHRDFLAALPQSLTLSVEGIGEVLFCHATPRSDDEIFTGRTADDRVRPMIAGVKQKIMVCGHTHMQFDRTVDDVRILNAGSVGMPYGHVGAHWLLIGPDVQFRNTAYDLSATAEGIRASGYPDAVEFAERNVRKPMSESEALQILDPVRN